MRIRQNSSDLKVWLKGEWVPSFLYTGFVITFTNNDKTPIQLNYNNTLLDDETMTLLPGEKAHTIFLSGKYAASRAVPATSIVVCHYVYGIARQRCFSHIIRISRVASEMSNMQVVPLDRWSPEISVLHDRALEYGIVPGSFWFYGGGYDGLNFQVGALEVHTYAGRQRVSIITTMGTVIELPELELLDTWFEPGLAF